MTALMVALPLVLLLLTGELSMIVALTVGVAFVWGYFGWTRKNAPRNYDPRHIPPDLMP